MKRFAIIGDPIAHSISPAIYNAVFPAMGIEAHYEAWHTPPEGVASALERLRTNPEMVGMNVTVPHKAAVIPLVDKVLPVAEAIGAVNCIVKVDGELLAHNTDKTGFVRSLRESAGCEPAGLRCVVLGSGGGARAVAYGLIEAGAAAVSLAGRNIQHVATLVDWASSAAPGDAAVEGIGWQDEGFAAACLAADLIVNTTPVGMLHTGTEAESPLPKGLIRPGQWICDIVYTPQETTLLREAKAAGARPIGGLDMLIYQAAQSVLVYVGLEPPIDVMREAALAALRR